MKRFGMLVATAALCAALGASGPSLAFDGDGQHCCGWRYGGDYSYGCGCYYGYVPGLPGLAVGRMALAASSDRSLLRQRRGDVLASPTVGEWGGLCLQDFITVTPEDSCNRSPAGPHHAWHNPVTLTHLDYALQRTSPADTLTLRSIIRLTAKGLTTRDD